MGTVIKALSLGFLLLVSMQAFASWPVAGDGFVDEDVYQYRGSEPLRVTYWDEHVERGGRRKSIDVAPGMTLTGARIKELARRGMRINSRYLAKISGFEANAELTKTPLASKPGFIRVDLSPSGIPSRLQTSNVGMALRYDFVSVKNSSGIRSR